MGVKVYFVYDGEGSSGGGREAYKAKITLPDSWMNGPVEKLRTFFCTTYNKKFVDTPLEAADMALKVGSIDLPMDGTVSQFVQEHNDIYVLHRPKVEETEVVCPGSLVCGNFGCGKRFLPEENGPEGCHHHREGPVFHDTYKYWRCCPDQKALDWEQFEAIPKCTKGPHAVASKPVTFASTPNAAEVSNVALSAEQLSAISQQQAAQQQQGAVQAAPTEAKTGPREFEQGKGGDEPGPIAEDGTAKCRNYGCQKRFLVAENSDTACRFHSAGPVFWDTYKYWKCCPDKKCYEFDDFAKIEGCTVGPHKR